MWPSSVKLFCKGLFWWNCLEKLQTFIYILWHSIFQEAILVFLIFIHKYVLWQLQVAPKLEMCVANCFLRAKRHNCNKIFWQLNEVQVKMYCHIDYYEVVKHLWEQNYTYWNNECNRRLSTATNSPPTRYTVCLSYV